jgi:hypothetical protein
VISSRNAWYSSSSWPECRSIYLNDVGNSRFALVDDSDLQVSDYCWWRPKTNEVILEDIQNVETDAIFRFFVVSSMKECCSIRLIDEADTSSSNLWQTDDVEINLVLIFDENSQLSTRQQWSRVILADVEHVFDMKIETFVPDLPNCRLERTRR